MIVTAIIVAAGKGTRLGSKAPKAFVKLNKLPLVEYSLRAYQRSPHVTAIVLVIPAGYTANLTPLFAKYPKLRAIVPGGKEREASVRNGLAACSHDSDIALIHDAARPLIMTRDIESVIAATNKYGAAILAAPVTDTIKLARDRTVSKTVDRAGLWKAQTPQGFARSVLLKAYAGKRAKPATDDSMLAEMAGVRVRIVPASSINIKVTTPHDLEIASWLLKQR
ncbi:MAG TPA: 2-C-methyl-D-erythritol 4-phosphate cytidylyltransferase [Candidatus Edwardsbacteria bacterium]|nr:2-C-methyl-D-erythritol 4-phosphate cytidylyltransferase [Candidatus Edwardsbacteria bacterium]